MLRGKYNEFSVSLQFSAIKDNGNGEQKSSTTMLMIVVYYTIPFVEMLKLSLFGNFSAPM